MKHIMAMLSLVMWSGTFAHGADSTTQTTTKTSAPLESKIVDKDFGKLPTYIKSDSLNLESEKRIFTYRGNVEVRQGDMILTADSLEGRYSASNKIEQLIAVAHVVVTKGDSIRATGERAVYTASDETVTLTENPELQQKGSILSADTVKILLRENRSTAEGSVRMKLVKKDGDTGMSTLGIPGVK